MADHDHDYHRGEMDIQEQVATFHMFNGMTKWGSLLLAAALLMLTMWFCTPIGFMGGAATFVVVMALGILVLRDKPSEDH